MNLLLVVWFLTTVKGFEFFWVLLEVEAAVAQGGLVVTRKREHKGRGRARENQAALRAGSPKWGLDPKIPGS